MNFAIRAVKQKGRMVVIDHALLEHQIGRFRDGERLRLAIKRDRERTVSDPMRKYYWAVVAAMIAEATGHSKEAIHEALKRNILGYIDETTGLQMVPSVFSDDSALTIAEKRAFIEEVRRWAFDFLDLVIPDSEAVLT